MVSKLTRNECSFSISEKVSVGSNNMSFSIIKIVLRRKKKHQIDEIQKV